MIDHRVGQGARPNEAAVEPRARLAAPSASAARRRALPPAARVSGGVSRRRPGEVGARSVSNGIARDRDVVCPLLE